MLSSPLMKRLVPFGLQRVQQQPEKKETLLACWREVGGARVGGGGKGVYLGQEGGV